MVREGSAEAKSHLIVSKIGATVELVHTPRPVSTATLPRRRQKRAEVTSATTMNRTLYAKAPETAS